MENKELDTISYSYYKEANMDFKAFLRSSKDAKNPLIREFFSVNPPQQGEFLICFSGNKPNIVMTNQRLWMNDRETKETIVFNLSDIAEFSCNERWTSFSVKIIFRNQSECTLNKISNVPKKETINLAIQHYDKMSEWKLHTNQQTSEIKESALQNIETLKENGTEINEADTISKLRKTRNWYLKVLESDTKIQFYGKEELKTVLRKKIIEGDYDKNIKVEVHWKDKEGKWTKNDSTLSVFAKEYFHLRILYQPVWAHTMAGLKWGILLGIGLKLLDTAILLATVDPMLSILFIVAIAVCFIPKIGWIGIVAISIVMTKFSSSNFFLMAIAASITGALLGCFPGMAAGGILGILRKNSLPKAKDALPEPGTIVLKSVVLPALSGGIAIVLYLLVFNPWLVKVLS